MDILFVIGPSNLKKILEKGEKTTKTLKKSQKGFIGFLTIIDAAYWYLWTQPSKNKNPPVAYVDCILKNNELHKSDLAVIKASSDGYLAKSKAFKKTVKQQKFDIVEQEFHVNFDVNLDNVERIVKTDVGKELTTH